MTYFLTILPKKEDGTINRQLLEFDDLTSATVGFHSNCAKYINAAGYDSLYCGVSDELGNLFDHKTRQKEVIL